MRVDREVWTPEDLARFVRGHWQVALFFLRRQTLFEASRLGRCVCDFDERRSFCVTFGPTAWRSVDKNRRKLSLPTQVDCTPMLAAAASAAIALGLTSGTTTLFNAAGAAAANLPPCDASTS